MFLMWFNVILSTITKFFVHFNDKSTRALWICSISVKSNISYVAAFVPVESYQLNVFFKRATFRSVKYTERSTQLNVNDNVIRRINTCTHLGEVDVIHAALAKRELSVFVFQRDGQVAADERRQVVEFGNGAPMIRSQRLINLRHVDDGQKVVDG